MTDLVTPLYAAVLGLIFVLLSVNIIRLRRALKISLGDGESGQMRKATRSHANFAEYVPLSLVLMLLLEVQTGASGFIHFLGLLLIAGRIMHAWGLNQPRQILPLRTLGMAFTFVGIISASAGIILGYII